MPLRSQDIPVPFSGFEHSLHEVQLENVFSQYEDDGERCASFTAEMMLEFANEYVGQVNRMMNEFVESNKNDRRMLVSQVIWSPDYSVATDTILINIDESMLKAIYQKVIDNHEESFRELVKEALEARSGFIPYFSNDFSTWGSLDEWKEPQIGLLLREAMSHVVEDLDWDHAVVQKMKEKSVYQRVVDKHIDAMLA